MISSISYDPDVEEVESFQFEQSKSNDLNMGIVNVTDENTQPNTYTKKTNDEMDTMYEGSESQCDDTKNIWKKLRMLAVKLHTNNISEKRSACFWCTCDFDNPPIYIPKMELGATSATVASVALNALQPICLTKTSTAQPVLRDITC